jgi:hypothetical protein
LKIKKSPQVLNRMTPAKRNENSFFISCYDAARSGY